jgi:HTH-type transcriptional regulator / antitoxin HipB
MRKGINKPIFGADDLVGDLAAARRRAGLNQKALAQRIGADQSYVSKVERGGVDLQTSTLIELSRALDLEPMLIPRQLVPAVRALQREIDRGAPPAPLPAYRLGDDDE